MTFQNAQRAASSKYVSFSLTNEKVSQWPVVKDLETPQYCKLGKAILS